MWFWIFMLLMCLLVPLTMAVCGRIFTENTPAFGSAFGYKTRRSTRNRNTWAFAHQYIGRLWFFSGVIMLPLSVLGMVLLALHKPIDTVGTVGGVISGIQCAVMVLTILPTEQALKRNFDDYGRRK